MSRLSRELCLPACLGIGIALYAYSSFVMPRGEGSIAPIDKAAPQPVQTEPQPAKPLSLKPPPLKPKPKVAASLKPDVTGAIGPQAATPSPHAITPEATPNSDVKPLTASEQMPEVPGIRVAALAPQAVKVQSPDATRWSPAVGYAPLVRTQRPAAAADQYVVPPRAKRPRFVRRPYRMRSNFSVVIGVGPRW